jgi:hypothetical protein
MAFGLQILGPSGQVWFDSNDATGGVPVGLHAGSSSFTNTYPSLAGRTLEVLAMSLGGTDGVTVDHSLGYPRMTVSVGDASRVWLAVVR